MAPMGQNHPTPPSISVGEVKQYAAQYTAQPKMLAETELTKTQDMLIWPACQCPRLVHICNLRTGWTDNLTHKRPLYNCTLPKPRYTDTAKRAHTW